MKAVVQRVSSAAIDIEGARVAAISRGLLVLVGIETTDEPRDRDWLADKLPNLRIFEDEAGKMNLSVADIQGQILLVPNFTLAGDARKGRRPSFDNAMRPERAEPEFAALAAAVARSGVPVQTGIFRATMAVSLENDGPVTILLDSRAGT